MKNEVVIQDIHVAVCNAVLELLGPAQEFNKARKPMLVDEKNMLGYAVWCCWRMPITERHSSQVPSCFLMI